MENQYKWRHIISNAWQYFIEFWISITCHHRRCYPILIIPETHDIRWFCPFIQPNCFEPKKGKIVFHEKWMTTIFQHIYQIWSTTKSFKICCWTRIVRVFLSKIFFIINYALFIFGGVEPTRRNNCGCAMNKNDVEIEFGCNIGII